jgi:hypothetical protein
MFIGQYAWSLYVKQKYLAIRWFNYYYYYSPPPPPSSSSSSSIGSTTLSWVSACSPVVEHSQQEGFTECRCQRHVKPQTWRTSDLERSNFRHKGEFCRKWRLPRHFWVLLHAIKHDMGQTALLPLRRKAC